MPTRTKLDIDAVFAKLPLFEGLSTAEIARLTQDMREIRLDKGQTLFNKGDECNGFHLLLVGQIKLAFVSPDGYEKVVEVIRPNQTFGEALMFMEKPYVVYSQALADSWILYFPKAVVFAELERDPKLARKMLAGLSKRLHQLVSDVEDYSFHSGKQRIIGYLLREPTDEETGNVRTVKLSIGKNVIASRLNMTQEHFSRILHELADSGLLNVRGREIHIPDVEKLRRYEG
ncbi:MAG: Crp/Fnr family transcriptional regulator [Azoarcus sp.]|jgi:CRP-like cAMP-binding protein|nr:Crp/Fnr family transcriptional regulator [Azoarcus sp.]